MLGRGEKMAFFIEDVNNSNEKELSYRWRRRAFLDSRLSSLNPQFSNENDYSRDRVSAR
jgi:hypothetical protein